MHPLRGCALTHATQAFLHHGERGSLDLGQTKQKPVLRGWQGAVLRHAKLAGGSGLAIEAPRGPMGLERRLAGWDERLKLVEGQAGPIQALQRAILHVGALYMCPEGRLLA